HGGGGSPEGTRENSDEFTTDGNHGAGPASSRASAAAPDAVTVSALLGAGRAAVSAAPGVGPASPAALPAGRASFGGEGRTGRGMWSCARGAGQSADRAALTWRPAPRGAPPAAAEEQGPPAAPATEPDGAAAASLALWTPDPAPSAIEVGAVRADSVEEEAE